MPLLGKQSAAAAAAAERYKDVPKQGRLDALRPYIIKYKIFPHNSDPANAPIRMEELKLLVRQWNMHHERNFWRNHPDKDSVVMALYKKLKELKAIKEAKLNKPAVTISIPKPDKKTDFARSPRKTMMTHKSHGLSVDIEELDDHLNNTGFDQVTSIDSPSKAFQKNLFTKKGYGHSSIHMDGDEHEAYLNIVSTEGLLAMSRSDGQIAKPMDPADIQRQLREERLAKRHGGSSVEFVNDGGLEDHTTEPTLGGGSASDNSTDAVDPKTRVKRKCAAALLNMSLREQMEVQFVNEGGLKSLLELALSTTDHETLRYCMSCILNLAGEGTKDTKLFDFNIIHAISQLGETHDSRVEQYVAKSLCFFTMLDDIEERLISDGIIMPLSKITLHSKNPVTRMIACKGLINLSHCLTGSIADTVNKNISHCLKKLCVLQVPFLSFFCANTIQVLSTLPMARQKIGEEGAIEILNTLIRNFSEGRTLKAVAIGLCNLSQLKSCRKDMVSMGIIEVLTDMLKNGGEDTVYLCTLALSNLTAQPDLRLIIGRKGAIKVLCGLLASEDTKTQAVASKSLANFACDANCRLEVVNNNAIEPMIRLLKSEEEGPRHDALGAICNLLSFEDTYLKVMDSNLISTLTEIMDHENLLEGISLALFNMSCWVETREKFVEQEGGTLLVRLLTNPNLLHLQRQILTSISNIASSPISHLHLLKSSQGGKNFVQALNQPIQDSYKNRGDPEFDEEDFDEAASKIARILMCLSTTEECCKRLVRDGAVLLLVDLSKQQNDNTKLCVSACYYNLSLKSVLTDHGFLNSLIDLSSTNINQRVVWCAMTFSNLTCYNKGRTIFGKEIVKVAPCLAAMMRSGCDDAEKIQKHCAIALCNSLSVWLKKDHIEKMVETGLIQDLIVIAVLRVNVDYIKTDLAKALANLLFTLDTRTLMVEQGIMHSLIRLTKQVRTSEVITLCISALTNLTAEPNLESVYSASLMEMNAIHVLVSQAVKPMAPLDVKKMCASAIVSLSRLPMTHKFMMKEKQLIAAMVRVGSLKKFEGVVEKCMEVLWNLCNDPDNHGGLLSQNVVSAIVQLIDNGNFATRQLGVCALCNLSCSEAAYVSVAEDSMDCLIRTMQMASMGMETRMNAMKAVCNLVVFYEPARKLAVDGDLVPALGTMLKLLSDEEEKMIMAKIMRAISFYNDGHVTIQDSKGMNILLRLSKLENAELKSDVSIALLNLSTCMFQNQLVEDGIIEAIFWLTLQDLLGLTKPVFERCSAVVRNLTKNEKTLGRVVLEDKLMTVLKKMADFDNDFVKFNACISLYNISCYGDSQDLMVRHGIINTIVGLAEAGISKMRSICSAALHQYPQELLKDSKIIAILMSLLSMDTSVMDDTEVTIKENSSELTSIPVLWEVHGAKVEYSRIEVKPSWQNPLVERLLPFISGKVEDKLEVAQGMEGSDDGPSVVSGGKIVGEYSKMMVEHVKQTPADFARPIPGSELSMTAKTELYKKTEEEEENEDEEDAIMSMNMVPFRSVGDNGGDGEGEGREEDETLDFDGGSSGVGLPVLSPPLLSGDSLNLLEEERYDPSLLMTGGSGEVSKALAHHGVSKNSLRASFATKITTSMPSIDIGGSEGRGSPKTKVATLAKSKKSKSFGKTFQLAKQKKTESLTNDYKQMLLMRENNLY